MMGNTQYGQERLKGKKGKKEARQEEEETKEQVGEHTVYNID